jgi:hypothetical protein
MRTTGISAIIVEIIILLGVISACSVESTLPPGTATPTPTESPTATPTSTPNPVPWVPDGVIGPSEYDFNEQFSDFEVCWRNDERYLYMAMRARTTGWLAIGFRPDNRMQGADMVFGHVIGGIASVLDSYSTGEYGPHPSDAELGGFDNLETYGGIERDGYTTIEFRRPLSSGDDPDRPLLQGKNKIIWAYASSDSLDQKHVAKGYGEIEIK